MADVELVIKIPEEIYKASQIIDVKHEDVIQIPLENIANGTPLDKIRAEIATLQNRCYSLTKGIMCAFCKFECKYKAESEEV